MHFPGTRIAVTIAFMISLLWGSLHASGADRDAPVKNPNLLERMMHPEAKARLRSPFQDKIFSQGPSFASKTFATSEYATGGKGMGKDKSFIVRSFDQVREAVLGRRNMAGKTLPEGFLKKDPSSGKAFPTGNFATQEFSGAGKTVSGGESTYATREIALKGKVQGALDNDPKLEEAVRKGLSFDDVRNLLNKGP